MSIYEQPNFEVRTNTAKLRAEIEQQTAEFLANGGEIQDLSPDASAYDLRVAEDKTGRKVWANKDTAMADFVISREGRDAAGYRGAK